MAFLLHFRILLFNYENNACQRFHLFCHSHLGCIFKLVQRTISNITWYFYILLSNSKHKLHNFLFHLVSSSQRGFPGGAAGKESACNTGDLGLISGFGRFPGEGISSCVLDTQLQYSCLENSMERGAWRAIDNGITQSWTHLRDNTHCKSQKNT